MRSIDVTKSILILPILYWVLSGVIIDSCEKGGMINNIILLERNGEIKKGRGGDLLYRLWQYHGR